MIYAVIIGGIAYILSRLAKDVGNLDFRITDVAFKGISLSGIKLSLKLAFLNTRNQQLQFDSLLAKVTLNSETIGTLERKEQLVFQPKTTSEGWFDIQVYTSSLLTIVPILKGLWDDAKNKAKIGIDGNLFLGSAQFPIKQEMEFDKSKLSF